LIDLTKAVISFDYQSSELAQTSRSLKTLYSTPEGTVPMDRGFGLSQEYVGYPIDAAKNLVALDIIEKTEKYEPDLKVKDISFALGNEGELIPTILITRSE